MASTIICAIEETTTEAVVPPAGELARALGARLVLAHVRRDPGFGNSHADRERARHASRGRGEAILRSARGLVPRDVEAEERVEFGIVADELGAIADETMAAFIVAGSRRRGAISAALLGSVSRTLASEAPCPVLIVAGTASSGRRQGRAGLPGSPSTVVVGVDGTERSVKATALAREIADRLGDRLLLAHAHETTIAIPIGSGRVSDGVSTHTLLTGALARAGDDATLVVENGPPAEMLRGVCAREHARLIVIGSGRSGGLRTLLANAVAEHLPGLAPCPVLVVPGHASATLQTTPALEDRRAA